MNYENFAHDMMGDITEKLYDQHQQAPGCIL